MSEPYDVTTEADRRDGVRRYSDRTGREWTESVPPADAVYAAHYRAAAAVIWLKLNPWATTDQALRAVDDLASGFAGKVP